MTYSIPKIARFRRIKCEALGADQHRMARFPFISRKSERGATLTGYSLAMATMVVVALGSMSALERSGTEFIIDSGTNIGEPRPAQEELQDIELPAAPNDGVGTPTGDGTDPGDPGDPAVPQPPTPLTNIPSLSSSTVANFHGSLGTNSLTGNNWANRDQVNLFAEGAMQVNEDFTIPGINVTVAAGTKICSYYLHYTGGLSAGEGYGITNVTVDFPGEILGFAETTDALNASDNWQGPNNPAVFSGARAMEDPDERATGLGTSTMKYDQLNIWQTGKDDVRIFARCPGAS